MSQVLFWEWNNFMERGTVTGANAFVLSKNVWGFATQTYLTGKETNRLLTIKTSHFYFPHELYLIISYESF